MPGAFGTDLYEAFLAVAETESFTAAAERLHCSQNTVSQRIRRLEDALGRSVFRRSSRLVELTPAGEALLPYARTIRRLHGEARIAVSGASKQGLRFGLPEGFAQSIVPAAAEFFERESGVAPLIHCCRSALLYERLLQDEVDIIMARRCAHQLPGIHLADERLVWVAQPGFVREPAHPLPLTLPPEGGPHRASALGALEAAEIPSKVIHLGNSEQAIEEAVRLRPCVTVLPESWADQELVAAADGLGLPALGESRVDLHVSYLAREQLGEEFVGRLAACLSMALKAIPTTASHQ